MAFAESARWHDTPPLRDDALKLLEVRWRPRTKTRVVALALPSKRRDMHVFDFEPLRLRDHDRAEHISASPCCNEERATNGHWIAIALIIAWLSMRRKS